MKRFTAGLLNRTKSSENTIPNVDSPEANSAQGVRLFCESGSPNNAGEEVLHLPVIVEAAESSPQAAAASAYQIRKFLSKDNYNRPHVQYNSIMLIRILSENPGPSFTRNLDGKFVTTVRVLLKEGKDQSVQQILRETLDALEANKGQEEGLQQLLIMWRQFKGQGARLGPPRYMSTNQRAPVPYNVPPFDPNAPPIAPSQAQPNQRVFGRNQLPPPFELASRVEEAKNTAKILLQLLQSTPTEEILGNDLIKEFAERCQSASRSMQEYINCDSPPPDDDTMQTLIEINEQLSLSLSRYQRAMLSARRTLGASSARTSPNPEAQAERTSNQPQVNHIYSPPVLAPNGLPESRQPDSAYTAPQAGRTSHKHSSSLSPVEPESATSTYSSVPDPPQTLTARLADRSTDGEKPLPSSPPPAPVMHHAEPAQDPFTDGAEASTYQAHPMEPVNYGAPVPARDSLGSQPRPGLGAYYVGDPTTSYIGRQASALNGLTMHGGVDTAIEMDGNSRDGRLDGGSHSDVSPLETRQPVVYRY